MKHIGNDEAIHVARVAMAGLPALLISLFVVVGFLSLFPLREALLGVGGVIIAGILAGGLLVLLKRRRTRLVLP